MLQPRKAQYLFALVFALGMAECGRLCAQGPWHEGFEGPDVSWIDAGGDVAYRIDQHARTGASPHSGRGCEQLRVTGNNGAYVLVAHPIGQARVIQELAPSVWVRADRPGVQIMARVVLPRSIDPRTRKPITTLIRGSGYTQTGSWQQLRIDEAPQLVERQLRVLRASYGPSVDAREAVIDQVVLNVYGGPGATMVWIDDLEVAGLVGRQPQSLISDVAFDASPENRGGAERLPSIWRQPGAAADTPSERPEVNFNGALLTVGGKAMYPRMIQHRGESLSRLHALGFNTVRLAALPTVDIVDEAKRLGLWLIAPPPGLRELEAHGQGLSAGKFGPDLDPVLVWDLGQNLSERELETNRAWAKAVRACDPHGRPIMCDADAELRAYSRHADLLMTHRFPLASSLELFDYSRWLRERPQLARPGTPFWTTVQTQLHPRLVEQSQLLSSGRVPPASLDDEQIRALVYCALAAGMRGICFESYGSLESIDPQTQLRAMMLELINLELDLIEPWAAGGSFVAAADCSNPQLIGAVLQTERARLLLPLQMAKSTQFAPAGTATGITSFVVPGVPDSNDAYELTPSGVRPLFHKRVTGGIRVAYAEGERPAPVVFTQDPTVISNLSKRMARVMARAVELQRELATRRLAMADGVDRELIAAGHPLASGSNLLAVARASLAQCDASTAARDSQSAYRHARRAADGARQLERAHWDAAHALAGLPASDPLASCFGTLPEFWRLQSEFHTLLRAPNQLAAGDFESLQALMQTGWRHLQRPQTDLATQVELSPDNPHSGQFSLRLVVRPTDPKQVPVWVESPPLWVTSAPVSLEPGQYVVIHGWAHVPGPIAGSSDGLMIMDSLSGEALAQRIGPTGGWQEFTLIRAAAGPSSLIVTFALTGIGEARLDDVTIQPMSRTLPRME